MIVQAGRSIDVWTSGGQSGEKSDGPPRALLIIRKQATPEVPMQNLNFLLAPSDQSWCCVGRRDYHKPTRRHKSSIEAGRRRRAL